MAHFAEIDENNIVLQVVVINDDEIKDSNGREQESLGVARCKELFGEDTNWVQTSYNHNIRYNYARIGDTFDSSRNAFIAPQPYPSWVLDENECVWEAPVPYPDSVLDEHGQPIDIYLWDEETLSWDLYFED